MPQRGPGLMRGCDLREGSRQGQGKEEESGYWTEHLSSGDLKLYPARLRSQLKTFKRTVGKGIRPPGREGEKEEETGGRSREGEDV